MLKNVNKVNKVELNIKTSYVTYGLSCDFNPEDHNITLQLCIDYQRLNNHTIKNWYLLLLVKESLDQLGQVQLFIQLNLTSAYYWMRIGKRNE